MKGYSIHKGVNQVNQDHYLGISELRGAVNDVNDMHQIATQTFAYKSLGVFTDKSATTANVLSAFREAEANCENGYVLFISYSGHGSILDYIPGIGKGIIKAKDAIHIGLNDLPELSPSTKAKSSLFGITETIGLFFNRRRTTLVIAENEKEILQAELFQIVDKLNIEELYSLTYADELKDHDIDIIYKYKEEILAQGISQRVNEIIDF